jgi:hypothetical protein
MTIGINIDTDMNTFTNDFKKMINPILTKGNTPDDCEKEVDDIINCITKDNTDDQIKKILTTIKMMEICKIKSQ